MKIVLAMLFFAGVLFVGCASSYTISDFKVQQTYDDTFIVSYNGNSLEGEKGTDITLLRCAEIAQQYGFAYFAVIAEENGANTSENAPSKQKSTSYNLAKPGLQNTIRCFKGIQIGPLYDVNVTIQSLRKKYGL